MSEISKDWNKPVLTITGPFILGKILKREAAKKNHCQCRSGSPDACPICTDMETGEKYY